MDAMEVVIGFAAGYWVGTRQGRQGMRQAMDSARAIWESPETRKLLGQGLSALEAAAPALDTLRKKRGNAGAAVIRGVVDDIMERRFERRASAA
jgi:hypothetical protein